MSNLDLFLSLLGTTDVRKKISIGDDVIGYLSSPSNSLECEDIGSFIDSLAPWLSNSNYKVCQNGLDILSLLVGRMKEDFRPYVQLIISPTIDRLGDAKDSVKEKAESLLLKLMEHSLQPQSLWDRLAPAFGHKNNKVREVIHYVLMKTLDSHGSASLSLNKLVPSIVKCLGDPTPAVRDAASSTLVEIYRHVGERVRMDLEKKGNLPPAKLSSLFAKFDELKESGNLLPTAVLSLESASRVEDETDRSLTFAGKRATSAPPVRRAGVPVPVKPAGISPGTSAAAGGAAASSASSTPAAASAINKEVALKRAPSVRQPAAGPAGAVDEEHFTRAFEDVPRIQLYSAKELEDHLLAIRNVIQDPNHDWSKRVDALKKFRSLLIAGASHYDELYQHIRCMEVAFQVSVKDLRSQVVREACITIAYMSQQLESKLEHFAEFLMTSLVNLIQNSAKVMATSGIVCIRFIIAHTHSPRLIPILTSYMTSKSKDIRRAMCEFLDQLLHTWPTHVLEKHLAKIQEAVALGIKDADPDARAFSRRAYGGFALHFPSQADALLHSLDATYQRLLRGEALSNSSSNHSLQSAGLGRMQTSTSSSSAGPSSLPIHPRSKGGSTENLSRMTAIPARKVIGASRPGITNGAAASPRSNSAIDLQAAQRAARYMKGAGGTLPLPRPRNPATPVTAAPQVTSPEHKTPRTTARPSRPSQSQPGSRSGSPSSRLGYVTYTSNPSTPGKPGDSLTLGRPRRPSAGGAASTPSRGPRSTNTSREPSPNRSGIPYLPKARTRTLSNSAEKAAASPARPAIAHRILQASIEAENALSDALARTHIGYDEHSDESETSSVCSERSFNSYHRVEQRHFRDTSQDISEMIHACASTHWAERREGLMGIHSYLRLGRTIPPEELRRLVDILGKMFTDAHTKVFNLFLDTLAALIETHKEQLHDWLFFLMNRLLNKLGSDLLNSVQAKTLKVLDLVRESFPYQLQLALLFRIMTNAVQTPNSRVKVAMLNYLNALATHMLPDDLVAVTLQTPASPGLMLGLTGMGHALNPETPGAAIGKVITWTSDQKSMEVRKAAEEALYALFSLHPAEMTRILNTLPKICQDSASQIIQSHLNRSMDASELSRRLSSSGGAAISPVSSPSTSASQPSTPLASFQPLSTASLNRTRIPKPSESNEGENLNPEDVYKSIRQTTAEIQNYSFEKSSLDSVIPAGDKVGVSTPKIPVLEDIRRKPSQEEALSPMERSERINMDKISSLFATEQSESRKEAITHLIQVLQEGGAAVIAEHFRPILKNLVLCREDSDWMVRKAVFNVWSSMLSVPTVAKEFENFAELILVSIVRAQRDPEKEVVRASESCAKFLAATLPVNILVRFLSHAIVDNYPENHGAIKILTRLVEQRTREEVVSILNDVMPPLIRATDHPESIVRKATVFCIVAIYKKAPTELQPFLESLNSSKIKLINVYIQRAEHP